MSTNIRSRIARLRERKTDLDSKLSSIRYDSLTKSQDLLESSSKTRDYISESMLEVDKKYTAKTFEESNRIQNQIQEICQTNSLTVSFRNQGSVSNNTHIKFYSDFDLLVLTEQFFALEPPLMPQHPYTGDATNDLKDLRKIIVDRLTSSFPAAKIDTTGSKAIRISGGSLDREIDIIAANWFNTRDYYTNRNEEYRGIEVLDLKSSSRVRNFPFLHNKKIDEKDQECFGMLRKLIRFVKSVRSDSDQKINVSSYDIAALCFNIPNHSFKSSYNNEILLVQYFLEFFDEIKNNSTARATMSVPNKTRKVFCQDGINFSELEFLVAEITEIFNQAN